MGIRNSHFKGGFDNGLPLGDFVSFFFFSCCGGRGVDDDDCVMSSLFEDWGGGFVWGKAMSLPTCLATYLANGDGRVGRRG